MTEQNLSAWLGDDIRSILESDPELDSEYLDHWVAEWEVADRWSTFP